MLYHTVVKNATELFQNTPESENGPFVELPVN